MSKLHGPGAVSSVKMMLNGKSVLLPHPHSVSYIIYIVGNFSEHLNLANRLLYLVSIGKINFKSGNLNASSSAICVRDLAIFTEFVNCEIKNRAKVSHYIQSYYIIVRVTYCRPTV